MPLRTAVLVSCTIVPLVFAQGCAGARRNNPFPKQEALQQLAGAPAPRVAPPDAKPVDTWALTGPFPNSLALVQRNSDDSPWQGLVNAVVKRRRGLLVATEDMHCLAREVGLFFLAHDKLPDLELRTFMAARCGVTTIEHRYYWSQGEIPPEVTDEVVFEHWQEQVKENLQLSAKTPAGTTGLWFGRAEGKAVAMVAAGKRRVLIDSASLVPNDNRVHISGEVLGPAERIDASVTRGAWDVTRCVSDTSVAVPRFSFECEIDPADPTGFLDILIRKPGRYLGDIVLEALVWPQSERTSTWVRGTDISSTWPEADVPLSEQLSGLINEIRSRANLGAVELSESQSELAESLAPHFFGVEEEEGAVEDLIAMGLSAGWEVDGMVQEGRFLAGMVNGNNPGRLLSYLLARPSGRSILLDPAVSVLAIGGLGGSDDLIGALFTGYNLFDEVDHEAQAKEVLSRLNAQRKKRKLPLAVRVDVLDELATQGAASVHAQGLNPEQGMKRMLEEVVERSGAGVRGWTLEGANLDDLVFPEEILDQKTIAVSVGVTRYRYPNEPWTRFIVFLLTVDGTYLQMAQASEGIVIGRG